MNAEERARVESWGRALTREVFLPVLVNDDPRTDAIVAFAEELATASGRVRVERRAAEEGLPGLRAQEHLVFHGVPLGRELPPFLEALAQGSASLGATGGPQAPQRVRLYVAQSCPHCPSVVSALSPAAAGGRVSLHVIDASLFTEDAEADRVRAVPTLLLETGLRLSGPVSEDQALALLDRPEALDARTLERLLEQGNAEPLAARFHERGRIPPSLVDLLCQPTFQTRLGAMALVELLVAQDRPLAASLVEPLWARLDQTTDEVRGDLLYLVGESGSSESLARLRTVADGPGPDDVREVAREAIDSIERRGSGLDS
jgi:hypothetical protein